MCIRLTSLALLSICVVAWVCACACSWFVVTKAKPYTCPTCKQVSVCLHTPAPARSYLCEIGRQAGVDWQTELERQTMLHCPLDVLFLQKGKSNASASGDAGVRSTQGRGTRRVSASASAEYVAGVVSYVVVLGVLGRQHDCCVRHEKMHVSVGDG
jgi:hypothetical protein